MWANAERDGRPAEGTLCSTPDGDFLRPAFPAIRMQHVSNLHPKFALEATPCVEVW